MDELERKINYRFKNKEYLRTALIHKSYNEGFKSNSQDNERLEFLGDSVINLTVTEYLYKKFINVNEGELSKLKAHLVSTSFLFDISEEIHLSDHILLGKGEEKNNGRNNKKIIASLFEAITGAIYLDSNFKVVSSVLIPFFKPLLQKISNRTIRINDYKSELQEVLQRNRKGLPQYRVISEEGKPPNILFTTGVYLDTAEIGRGTGSNKREAEQDAALNALKNKEVEANYEKLSEVFFIKND